MPDVSSAKTLGFQPNLEFARDRFFSIDEFGPVAIKIHGGRRLVQAGECPTVPQFQKN
jgi:hypothetical protein